MNYCNYESCGSFSKKSNQLNKMIIVHQKDFKPIKKGVKMKYINP